MNKSLFEQNGGTYRQVNDYRIPNLTVLDEPESHIRIGTAAGKTRLIRGKDMPMTE